MAQRIKRSACNEGNLGSTPGSGRSPGERNGNPLWYSCLETEKAGRLQSMGSQRVRHDWATSLYLSLSVTFIFSVVERFLIAPLWGGRSPYVCMFIFEYLGLYLPKIKVDKFFLGLTWMDLESQSLQLNGWPCNPSSGIRLSIRGALYWQNCLHWALWSSFHSTHTGSVWLTVHIRECLATSEKSRITLGRLLLNEQPCYFGLLLGTIDLPWAAGIADSQRFSHGSRCNTGL